MFETMFCTRSLTAMSTFAVVTLALGVAGSARADVGPSTQALVKPEQPARIYNGIKVEGCGWPTVVAVEDADSLCSGTLVHERVVIYAAHCGDGEKTLTFGNDIESPGQRVIVRDCQIYPEWGGLSDSAHDWAYCVLDEPVPELAITPPLMGCEHTKYLPPGKDVAIVGFGLNTTDGTAGVKRWGMAKLHGLTGGVAQIGGAPKAGVCPGDSGGPAFVQYGDDSWHVFGIASSVLADCGGPGTHALVSRAVPWIEESTGLDISPCHTATGKWEPGPTCKDFSVAGSLANGGWQGWCAGADVSDWSEECGAPFSGVDTTPPQVSITAPEDGSEFAVSDDITISITAVDEDVDDDGSGVTAAWVVVDDNLFPQQQSPPFEYTLRFPGGSYSVVAMAEDGAGNVGVSDVITIHVGGRADSDAGGGTGDSESDAGDPDDDGCGCRAPAGGQRSALALLLVVLLSRRRRRRLR